jgi:hypothetical protein
MAGSESEEGFDGACSNEGNGRVGEGDRRRDRRAIDAAQAAGAAPANAALLAATMLSLAGAAAQVGIPARNRELAGERLAFPVGCKWIFARGERVRVKLQHDDLVAIQAALRARGRILPLPVLRARLEEQAWARPDGEPLELHA